MDVHSYKWDGKVLIMELNIFNSGPAVSILPEVQLGVVFGRGGVLSNY